MKILFLSTYYPPLHIGGAEISASLLTKALFEEGCEVKVLTGVPLPEDKNYLVKSFKGLWPFRGFEFFLKRKILIEIEKYIEKFRPDIIHAHDYRSIIMLSAIKRKVKGISTVATIRDYWPICLNDTLNLNENVFDCGKEGCDPEISCFRKSPPSNPLRNIWDYSRLIAHKKLTFTMRKNSLENYGGIIFTTKYLKSRIEKNLNKKRLNENLDIIPNIVSNSNKGAFKSCRKIFYAGGLLKYKGIDYALEGLKDFKDIEVVISGSGSEKQWQSLKNAFNLGDNFNFVGKLDYPTINSFFKDSAMTISPSLWPEPFSRVIHESFSHGTPVIATDIGGQKEAISKSRGGLLVNPNSPSELALKVKTLIDDAKVLKQCSDNAYEYVRENMNPVLIAKKHIDFYNKCLNSR